MRRRKYRYDRRAPRHRKRKIFKGLFISILITVILVATIVFVISKTEKKPKIITGPTQKTVLKASNSNLVTQTINEPNYTFQLPLDWQQTKSVINNTQIYTWHSGTTDPKKIGRELTIYSDPIPATYPVTYELPLTSNGSTISYGNISDNCKNFTSAGSTKSLVPVLARWSGVDFYCNIPGFVDVQIGTGTIGSINSVTLTGPQSGAKHYFFLYKDRNISTDYAIFYAILTSFKAK